MITHYSIQEITPYINWLYFFHAWDMNGKPKEAKQALRADAEALLKEWEGHYFTHATFDLFPANSDGDDLIVADIRIPMLRQQKAQQDGTPNLSLVDFVRPKAQGIADRVGIFATSVDAALPAAYAKDDYLRMLSQVLADRLAEGTAEKMHEYVRRVYWGYAPNEQLTMEETHAEAYQGIRPAVGYPSLPDTSVNFLLNQLLPFKSVGIQLTETGMMNPHASVSGLMFAHPQSRYFDLGRIGDDQIADYAKRRGIPADRIRKFLKQL